MAERRVAARFIIPAGATSLLKQPLFAYICSFDACCVAPHPFGLRNRSSTWSSSLGGGWCEPEVGCKVEMLSKEFCWLPYASTIKSLGHHIVIHTKKPFWDDFVCASMMNKDVIRQWIPSKMAVPPIDNGNLWQINTFLLNDAHTKTRSWAV